MRPATVVTKVINRPNSSVGDAVYVRLSDPYEGFEYLYISEAIIMGEPETYAFGTTEDGVKDNDLDAIVWSELICSFKGDLSWRLCLSEAGYFVEDSDYAIIDYNEENNEV